MTPIVKQCPPGISDMERMRLTNCGTKSWQEKNPLPFTNLEETGNKILTCNFLAMMYLLYRLAAIFYIFTYSDHK